MKSISQFFKDFEKDIAFYNENTELLFAWAIVFGSIAVIFLNTVERGVTMFLSGVFLSAILLVLISLATIYYLYHVSISSTRSFLSKMHRFLNTSITVREYVYGLFYAGKNLIVRACHARFHLRGLSRTT